MDLHNLAAWSGHDVETLQRRYSHIIARYRGAKPTDLDRELSRARAGVKARPSRRPTIRPGRSGPRSAAGANCSSV